MAQTRDKELILDAPLKRKRVEDLQCFVGFDGFVDGSST